MIPPPNPNLLFLFEIGICVNTFACVRVNVKSACRGQTKVRHCSHLLTETLRRRRWHQHRCPDDGSNLINLSLKIRSVYCILCTTYPNQRGRGSIFIRWEDWKKLDKNWQAVGFQPFFQNRQWSPTRASGVGAIVMRCAHAFTGPLSLTFDVEINVSMTI